MRLRINFLGLNLLDLELTTDEPDEEVSLPLPSMMGLPAALLAARGGPAGMTCEDPNCTDCPPPPPGAPKGPVEGEDKPKIGFVQ